MRKTFKPGAIFCGSIFFWERHFGMVGAVFADSEPAADVYVDSNYSDTGGVGCGDHTCAFDGFKTIGAAVAKVAPGGTVHILPGTYEDVATTTIDREMEIIGENITGDITIASAGNTVFIVKASKVTIKNLKLFQTIDGSVNATSSYEGPVIRVGTDDLGYPITGTEITGNEIAGGDAGIYLAGNSAESTISGNNILIITTGSPFTIRRITKFPAAIPFRAICTGLCLVRMICYRIPMFPVMLFLATK